MFCVLFLIPRGFGSLTAGSCSHTINTAPPVPSPTSPIKKVPCCPTASTVLILFFEFLLLWYYFFVFSRRVCVMFTSLESEAFYLQRMVYLSYKKPREANLTSCDASKGWKKCNVYCCTIFSNKRTQNLFALICMQTLPDDWHFFFSYLGPGWHALFSRVPSVPPLLPPSHFFPLGPISSCWICIHSVCICTANLFLSGVYSLPISPMSVPAECEHKCERLLVLQMRANYQRG